MVGERLTHQNIRCCVTIVSLAIGRRHTCLRPSSRLGGIFPLSVPPDASVAYRVHLVFCRAGTPFDTQMWPGRKVVQIL